DALPLGGTRFRGPDGARRPDRGPAEARSRRLLDGRPDARWSRRRRRGTRVGREGPRAVPQRRPLWRERQRALPSTLRDGPRPAPTLLGGGRVPTRLVGPRQGEPHLGSTRPRGQSLAQPGEPFLPPSESDQGLAFFGQRPRMGGVAGDGLVRGGQPRPRILGFQTEARDLDPLLGVSVARGLLQERETLAGLPRRHEQA